MAQTQNKMTGLNITNSMRTESLSNEDTYTGWENSGASSLIFAILTRTVAVPE